MEQWKTLSGVTSNMKLIRGYKQDRHDWMFDFDDHYMINDQCMIHTMRYDGSEVLISL
jgi:hypothetical protein